jgi:hypothetical protein
MVRKPIERDWRQEKMPSVDKGCKQVSYSFPGGLLLKTNGAVSD